MRPRLFEKKRSAKGMPLPLFWAAVSVVYALTVAVAEFKGVPIDGPAALASVAMQWGVVALCGAGAAGLLSLVRPVAAVGLPLFSLVSGVLTYLNLAIGQRLTATGIEIALVNDATMWATMISPMLALTAIASLAIGIAAAWVRIKRVDAKPRTMLAVGAASLLILLTPTCIVGRLNAMVANRLPCSIVYATRDYLRNRTTVATQRNTFDNTPVAAPPFRPDVVVVLGESLRADHLSLNGYPRPTTGRLEADTSLVSFPYIYSQPTHTYASVPRIMTRADSLNINAGFEEQSFITIFKRAGYRTAWIANQDLSSSYAYFAHEADTLVYVNANRSLYSYEPWLDTDILPRFEQWFNATEAPSLTVVHSIGSHWWYPSHYTAADRRFTPEVTHKDVGRIEHEALVNSYDNTIVATDRFLDSLFTIADSRPSVVIFISDHGESLGENGVRLHGSESEPLHRPACIVHWSPAYASMFPAKVEALRARRNAAATTDAVFHTVIDAASIATPILNVNESLCHPADTPQPSH